MKTALLLNDKRITWYENGEEHHASPGFIYTDRKALHFGRDAEQQSRLHPLNTHHTFWHRISQDPFPRPVVNCRHAADMVFAHLNALFEAGTVESETQQAALLLTPANYNESQLALLSGVAGHSRFKPNWMMPIPLAAAASQMPDAEACVVVEQYQHGLTLSLIRKGQQAMVLDSVQLLPDLGFFSVANKLIQVASDAFVEQTRYNPQQNAEWEQSLYDDLPRWLALLNQRETVISCQLQAGNQTVSASLQTIEIMDELAPSLEKLQQQWLGLKQGAEGVSVLLAGDSHLIPGMMEVFAEHPVNIVPDRNITRFAASYVSKLDSDDEDTAVALVRDIHLDVLAETSSDFTSETLSETSAGKTSHTSRPAQLPTEGDIHWLCQGVARPIDPEQGCCLALVGGEVTELAPGAEVVQPHVKISALAMLERVEGLSAQLNGQEVQAGKPLKPGDVLTLGKNQVTFILVVHGMAGENGS